MVRRVRRSDRGSVLILALWTISILAMMSLCLAQSVQQKVSIARRLEERETLRGVMQTVAKRIVEQFRTSGIESILLGRASIQSSGTLTFAGSEVLYEIDDENRKININTSSPEILTSLFVKVANLGELPAAHLAYAVIDYRDEDNFTSQFSDGNSEKDGYETAGLPPPKNADFEFLTELFLVKGITKDIYNSIKDYITIYGDGRVNINTADAQTLVVIGFSEDLADKVIAFRKGDDLEERTADDYVFSNVGALAASLKEAGVVTDAEVQQLGRYAMSLQITTTSGFYRLKVNVKAKTGDRIAGHAVSIFSPREGIKYWLES